MNKIPETRVLNVRKRMAELDVDFLILGLSADLPWLTGYTAMPLERMTALVLPREGDAKMIIPRMEQARVDPTISGVAFEFASWKDGQSTSDLLASIVGDGPKQIGFDDRTWAIFLMETQAALPKSSFMRASHVTAPLRMVKDWYEMELLRDASKANDRVAEAIFRGEIALVGQTEKQLSKAVGARIIAEGHEKVNFSIVAAGSNAASPHHEASNRIIQPNELVLFDFGGTMNEYCSDMTRMVFTGSLIPQKLRDAYAVLKESQAAGVAAGQLGVPCVDVDVKTYDVIRNAGYGDYILHRTGHGIGMEEHEDPYMAPGYDMPIIPGFAYSVEPGIYVEGDYGMRLEDIVLATEKGPENINFASHDFVCVEA